MPFAIRRTSIVIEFASAEVATTFVARYRGAGLPGTPRLSGVEKDKVKLGKGRRIELADLERALEAAGLGDLLAAVRGVKILYAASRD